MIRYVILLLALFSICFLNAQNNLVNNGSFEIYSACPTTLDQVTRATGWSSYSGSPDYFNVCAPPGNLSVPSNGFGYQNAYSGVGYAGLIAYDIGGFVREIIGSQLSQTLAIGSKYFVSMKVALAEFDAVNKQYVPCNKIGIRFSTVSCLGSDFPYPGTDAAPINNFAHVYTNTIISDTLNWTTVSGSFIADSSYKYVMIGNFFDDANTDTIYRSNGIRSYFFVDDICVSTSSMPCSFPTGINEQQQDLFFKVLPNPCDSYFSITGIEERCHIILHDNVGNFVLEADADKGSRIDVSSLPDGFYFLNLVIGNIKHEQKIVVIH